jgi:DNA polymerase-3 subunit delta'
MPLTPLAGHADLRRELARAVATGRLPQVMLLTGPTGVGKQRLALWLAQRLLCTEPEAEPCGRCISCRRVLDLAHPDVHWLVPIPRPKAGDTDKQVEEAAESLEAAMAERRKAGSWSAPDGMSSHGIASARWLQRRATMKAAEGGWRVFIIGRAERLVPQESSPEAANALLKLLEEPPERALFVLTTAEPGLVLPTIRSRAVPLRMGRLDDTEVAAYATAQGLVATAEQVKGARGAIGRLQVSDDGGRGKAIAAARAVLSAASGTAADRATLALKQPIAQARGEFTAMLDALVELLEREAREAAALPAGRQRTGRAGTAIELVLATREKAQGNVNPQLALGGLVDELAALEAA